MTLTPITAELERRLLAAPAGLSGVRRVEELLERLRPALEIEGDWAAGIGIHDDERGLVVYHLLEATGRAPALLEVPVSAAHVPGSGARGRECLVQRLSADTSDAVQRRLAAGFERMATAALYFGERALGTLFLAVPRGVPLDGEWPAYLASLARIVEPHAWNCITDQRFSRGDRRRDALRDVSRAINTSLELHTVLHLARTAIGSIEGHRASWIGLLEEDRRTWLRHERPADYHADDARPCRCATADSVMARLVATGRTHESDDLERLAPFPDDRELLAQGVRRYVATPLRAGGKMLGAFLFGSDDPHPALRIDVWLLENIAVQIALAIDNAQHHEELRRLYARREQQNVYLREEIRSELDALGMIGSSPAMRGLGDQIARVGPTDSTVLISGPTGVGKELVARAIHEAGPRRDQPLVKLNCAAIPEGMVESELFGHERGAFTSAVERRIGRFELAHNGTLFLDEIGELSPSVQSKLLRVLQSGEFERVGGSKTLASNARILAATNRDLGRAVAGGAFRSDLYYRLNVFPIAVPPLEARREDVPELARAFVEHFARRMGKRFEDLDPRAIEGLSARAWPGNVRELKHVIERAVILCDGPLLTIDEAPHAVPESEPAMHPAQPSLGTLEEVEASHIRTALARTGWIIEGSRGAASLLGMKGSTLRFRMKRMGIRRPE